MDASRRRRRAFALAAAGLLAVVGASSGLGFAADTGATPVAAATGGGPSVEPARPGMALPHDGEAASLTVAAGVAGAVAAPGDLFLVDTTGAAGEQHASLYVTNLAAAAASLRGFVLPIAVWSRAGGSWRRLPGDRYVTSSAGHVDLELPPGGVYDVSLETGGAWVGGETAVPPQFYLAL